MPQFLEPPPTYITEWNWHWAQWFNKVYESNSFRGGLVGFVSGVVNTTSTAGSYTPINFDTTEDDTYSMYDRGGAAGGADRLIIPPGVQRLRYTCQVQHEIVPNTANVTVETAILFNATQTSSLWVESSGDNRPGQGFKRSETVALTGTSVWTTQHSINSGVVAVQDGDEIVFGARHTVNSGTVTTAQFAKSAVATFFAWEIIE